MSVAARYREYAQSALRRAHLASDPVAQFKQWFAQAEGLHGGRLRKVAVGLYKWVQLVFTGRSVDVNAMALATVDEQGRPSVRMVLLKGVDARGFIFYTNYESRKGQELSRNPHAALVFYWPDLERQVCIHGTVSPLPREESEAYFKTRPRGSQLAAWASPQSRVIAHRDELDAQWREMAARFPGPDVPLPPFWGGYVLSPTRMEFWQGRPIRLHDRFCYTKQPDGQWRLERLAP